MRYNIKNLMKLNSLIQDASALTPDPEGAYKNLERFYQKNPVFFDQHAAAVNDIARLFAYSRFLADHSLRNPSSLSRALTELHLTVDRQNILSRADEIRASCSGWDSMVLFRQNAMKLLRELKKYYLLIITMKDISGVTDIRECMSELSALSEALLDLALDMSFFLMRRKFGLMRENRFSIIGMGKLGAAELNYSSDIDIIAVYESEDGFSTGTLNPFGIRYNKISSREYYCALTETVASLLQTPTEDGLASRVDLRLRPNGQKGALSLSLASYASYYESWGKTWERVALVRARPVAGDNVLGRVFMQAVEPFVWKRSLDYNDIEEIRELKKKIDILSDINDVKRGYGGIREMEFFIQTFQLLYGGENEKLRRTSLVEATTVLKKEGLLSSKEADLLSENYFFLRRLENILQMKDDLQTHTLPSQSGELAILAKKMSFDDTPAFLADLRLRRLKVRDMYNSLMGNTGTTEDVMLTLKDDLPDHAILDYLSFRGFRDPDRALKNITAIKDQISSGKTLQERTLLKKAVPLFLQQIISSVQKDRSLGMFVTFMEEIGNHASYIDLLLQRADAREIIIRTFSASTLLSRLLLRMENMEGIFEYPDIRMDYRSLQERLGAAIHLKDDPAAAIRKFKAGEELKSGMLFLKGSIDIHGLLHTFSMLADAVMRAVVKYLHAEKDFAVIALGGYGARELNTGSDLDIIFIGDRSGSGEGVLSGKETGFAEETIRILSGYTADGIAYKTDMRLRPDGSRGMIINDVGGYENYYLRSAQPWEIQSLLRARPVAGDMSLLNKFQAMKKRIIMLRGKELSGSYVTDMRRRIMRSISSESSGYDVKLGPGGIKEIEFLVQYLQLKNASRFPEIIVHNTRDAVKSLSRRDIIDSRTEGLLLNAHGFLRTIETLLRLNEESRLKKDSEITDIIVRFLNLGSEDELISRIRRTGKKISALTRKFYGNTR
jgi:[glutamine synthetase] adenylyltransferase / [glutamine synthetase]-adenylyl-L-tyrosine phosphorylase